MYVHVFQFILIKHGSMSWSLFFFYLGNGWMSMDLFEFSSNQPTQIHVFNFHETWQDWGKSLSVAWLQVTSEFTSNNSFFTNWKEWIKSDKIALLLLSYMWCSVTEMWVHKYHRNYGVWIYVDTFLSLLESPLLHWLCLKSENIQQHMRWDQIWSLPISRLKFWKFYDSVLSESL